MTEKKLDAGWNLDNSYVRLPESLYTKQNPTPVQAAELVVFNEAVAAELGLQTQSLRNQEGAEIFAGNKIPEGALPIAQAYAGHQFGHLNRLGDGRAVLLGEQLSPHGERFDIQLKGSGPTPYSRRGDGRAALGPMLREYIISEAMVGLGIPTTRSLAVVTTGEPTYRETVLTGAVLTRVAASHIRVGTFQYAAQWGHAGDLQALADYTLQRHYPDIIPDERRYITLLQQVIKRQAKLIAKWQLVGFIHGVMNTDNMAISGETIDYGPCAFMDTYDPATVFSSIDVQGRYAYGNQPRIGVWNLARFAEALLSLLHAEEAQAVQEAEAALSEFSGLYREHWLTGMRAKLGVFQAEAGDEALIENLLELMQEHKADYTNTFLALTFDRLENEALFHSEAFIAWHKQWQARLERQAESLTDSKQLMRSSNPAVIPRNHRVEEALAAAVNHGDYTVMEQLNQVLAQPYAHTSEQAKYADVPENASCGYQTFCGT